MKALQVFFAAGAALLAAGIASAQVTAITAPACSTGVVGGTSRIILSAYTPEQPFSCNLAALPTEVGVTYTISPGSPSCCGGVTLTMAADGNLTVSGCPTVWPGNIDFSVTGDDGVGDFTQQFRIPVTRPQLDLVFVLDHSGSMRAIDFGAGTLTRWDKLKTGVDNLASIADLTNGTIADKTAFVRFSSDRFPADPAAPTPFLDLTSVNTAARTSAYPLPTGATAMGEGLLEAKARLGLIPASTCPHQQVEVLFTDGDQNARRQVNAAGTQAVTDGVLPTDNLNNGTNSIKIVTVGVRAGAVPAVLSAIATANPGPGGGVATGTFTDSGFDLALASQISLLFAGSSPQIIDLQRNQRLGGFIIQSPGQPVMHQNVQSGTHEVSVNKDVEGLLFDFLGVFSQPSARVWRNGVEINGTFVKRTQGQGYCIFSLDFTKIPKNIATSEGSWKITIRDVQNSHADWGRYAFLAFADDHRLFYQCSAGNPSLKVGNPINPSVKRLTWGGKALKGPTVQVQAVILKPGQDLGDLLARTDRNVDRPSGDDAANAGLLKYFALLNDSAFLKKMQETQQVVTLAYNAADSTYSGQFAGTDVSGVYQVLYHIQNNSPETGNVVRFEEQSVYVRFPDVDMDKSNVVVSSNTKGTVLTFRPVASNGKFIGPGWGSAIVLDAPNAKISGVTDNGDGSYSVSIAGSLDGKGKLSLGTETLLDGNLAQLKCYGPNASFMDKVRCWMLSMGLPAWLIWVVLAVLAVLIGLLVRKKKK